MLSALVIQPRQEEERDSFGTEDPGVVRVLRSTAQSFHPALTLRGVTEAERSVAVTARTAGLVGQIPREGAPVAEGDLLCALEEEAQQASYDRARAAYRSAELDHQGIQRLRRSNLSSEREEAAAQANLDAAKATMEQSQLALEWTRIQAPFAGIVDSVPAEVGVQMRAGDPCALLLDLDPIIIHTDVAEADVEEVREGAPVDIHLLTGLQARGEVVWVSRSANAGTRTFAVEVQVPNPGYRIRDGLSARLQVQRVEQLAHKVSPSVLVFDDSGKLVVRTVTGTGTVVSYQVRILQDSTDGLYVGGLPAQARIMTLGQHYVRDGVQVQAREVDSELAQRRE